MKKINLIVFALCITIGVQGQHQLPNGGFEGNWVDCIPWTSANNTTKAGIQPDGWKISNVRNVTAMAEKLELEDGNVAIKFTNTSTAGQPVPAYLTLGTPWATAETWFTSIRNADGGTYGGIDFVYRPDAISFKYKRGDATNSTERASAIAYLWTGEWSQADVPGNTAVGFFGYGNATKVVMNNRERNILGLTTPQGGVVSKSENAALIASGINYYTGNQEEWTDGIINLDYGDYKNTDVRVEKLNIIFSASDYFGERSSIISGNSLTIDDVKLLYYHGLSQLLYEGQNIDFDEETYSYDLSGVEYEEEKLTYTKKGQGSTVSKTFDATTSMLTIRVNAEDYDEIANNEAFSEYSVQFMIPKVHTTYSNNLMVSIDGGATPPQPQDILVTKHGNGTYDLSLNNFMLGGGENTLAVGNIKLTNITPSVENDIITLTANQTIEITAGDLEDVDSWIGPSLGTIPVELMGSIKDNQLTCNINIDMTESLDQIIKVVFAPKLTLNEENSHYDDTKTGLYCIELTRTFKAENWNALCFPFAMTAAQIAINFGDNAEVVEFASATDGQLNFTTTSEIAAGVPYLLKVENDFNDTIYASSEIVPAESVTHDAYTLYGNYSRGFVPENTYFISDDKFYKSVVTNSDVLQGFSAYLTENVVSPTQSLSISINGNATTTSIVNFDYNNTSVEINIYNLAGQLVRKNARSLDGLVKGIYIVNGKKIVIK